MTRRALARGAGALALAGGVALSELRHRRALRADQQYALLLRSPLRGSPVPVVSADGTALHAEVLGPDSAPTVALVPGWTEDLRVFDLLTRGLRDRGFRVVSCDLRGQGSSGAPVDGDQRIERYGEDLEAVLRATCWGRSDVIVAGHSMGAMSVVSWAGLYEAGARVRAAALINVGVFELAPTSRVLPARVPVRVAARLLSAGAVRLVLGSSAALPPVSTPVGRSVVRFAAFGPDASAGLVAFYERMLLSAPRAARAAAGVTLSSLDLREAVGELFVPTLVVAGEADRLTPPAAAEEIAEHLPELFELLLLPATGHMSVLERPVELAEALVRLGSAVGVVPAGAGVAGSAS